MDDIIVVLSAGNIEYDLDKAKVPIDDLIGLLESAKSEGATHVVQDSGNTRGAKWQHIRDTYDWADDL